jgi:hypothetical protein
MTSSSNQCAFIHTGCRSKSSGVSSDSSRTNSFSGIASPPLPHTLVVGYTDTIIGYLPDPSAYAAGLYEATVVPKILDLPPFTPDAARAFTTQATALTAKTFT